MDKCYLQEDIFSHFSLRIDRSRATGIASESSLDYPSCEINEISSIQKYPSIQKFMQIVHSKRLQMSITELRIIRNRAQVTLDNINLISVTKTNYMMKKVTKLRRAESCCELILTYKKKLLEAEF